MNTITTNRWNDHKGEEIAKVIDRMAAELPPIIDGILSDCWDGYDPWGSTMELAFASNYVRQFYGATCHETFHSPYTTGDPDEGWLYTSLVEAVESGELTLQELIDADEPIDKALHAFKLAGLDY